MPLTIAVVQQNGNPGQPEENRCQALHFAARALELGAQIILFHEELLVGYAPDLRELAEPVDGPTTQAFQALLCGRDALIIYGLTEKDGDDCYISAPVVSTAGVLANYRKTHLWWNASGLRHEPSYYRPGERLVAFEFGPYRCGIMICYDGDFPEMTRAYANLGCSVLFWMNNRDSRGHAEVKDLAYRNSMIIAASCCCGADESGHVCRGGSNITDADGLLLSEIWDQEGVISASVSPERALTLRGRNPWYRGQRPELYYQGVSPRLQIALIVACAVIAAQMAAFRRQRIAIARASLKGAREQLLDEITAELYAAFEESVLCSNHSSMRRERMDIIRNAR